LERFKDLISSPPVVEELLAERRYNGSKPTDYYYARWQSNAFLISIATNRQHVALGGGDKELAQVYSRFDDLCWTVFGVKRPLKIGSLGDISPTNELVLGTYWASIDIGRILNCGVDHLKPGEVTWTANTYRVTNESGRAIVSGEARTNLSGVVTQISMDISAWPRPLNPRDSLPINYYWQLEYQYDQSVSDLYPSVIKRYVIKPKERLLRDEIHIHSITTGTSALPRDAFAYAPFVRTNSWILHATNDSFIYKDKSNVFQLVQTAAPSPKPPSRFWFFLFAGTFLLVPAALFRILKVRAKQEVT